MCFYSPYSPQMDKVRRQIIRPLRAYKPKEQLSDPTEGNNTKDHKIPAQQRAVTPNITAFQPTQGQHQHQEN